MLRVKNGFADLQPLHHRYLLFNLQLTIAGSVSGFAELQVHHDDLLQHHAASKSHELYEYFRMRAEGLSLATAPTSRHGLGRLVNASMDFLIEAASVPVLLSLLVQKCLTQPEQLLL